MEENKGNVVNHFEAGANCQVFNGPVSGCVFAMPGSNVTQQTAPVSPQPAEMKPDLSHLQACAKKVRAYFWGESSMAVIFCVCRDLYGYANNMSQFEREFHLTEGLLSNTFRNNPFMQLPVGKWREQGAKDRVLRLAEAYRKAVEEEGSQQIPAE